MPMDPQLLAAGIQHHRSGDFQQAREIYLQLLAANPQDAAAFNLLGAVCIDSGQLSEAGAYLAEALRLNPALAAAHDNLGLLLTAQNRLAEAVVSLRRAAELDPRNAQTQLNLAGALLRGGQQAAAIAAFRQVVELAPDNVRAHAELARLLCEQGRHAEAVPHLRHVTRLLPDDAGAHNNLGVALAEAGSLDAAVQHYRRALAIHPANANALYNLGNAYLKLGDVQAALEQYDRAIELRPDYVEARHNRAAVWLLQGRFAEGFPEYEWRLRSRDYPPAHWPWTSWNGEPLAGRTIVLCPEQGFGDTLQFVRYAALMKAQGARVLVVCNAAQGPILAPTPGVDALITPGMPLFEADFCVPMMSIPQGMQTTLKSIPTDIPYILADQRLVETWRHKLAEWEGFKVGIVWQGNSQRPDDRSRSIALSHYGPLAHVRGVRLVNLQKGPGVEQLADVARSWSIVDFADEVDASAGAFMDTAAIMKNLDLVITSDTAAAHLAGALGVNVWVALQLVPDWRWMLEREDNPWYPTMRLFRQTRWGDWPGVFERIAGELERLVARGR